MRMRIDAAPPDGQTLKDLVAHASTTWRASAIARCAGPRAQPYLHCTLGARRARGAGGVKSYAIEPPCGWRAPGVLVAERPKSCFPSFYLLTSLRDRYNGTRGR